MPVIEIDGRRIEAAAGLTVLTAAESAGIAIPHFCYHPAFAPEGSCRMCLVEIEGSPKLELACSTVIRDGLKVRTDTAAVRDARRSVLEFLLADHPIDCPICDKAGECELQDNYRDYGLTEGRNAEAKERREKKVKIGEKLLLDRERCIQCTRCVRFLAEVTKTNELGVVERGVHSEISTFPGELVRSVDSGNLVDLCPVGAITSTDFRFKTRPWFLRHADSICPLCARGCNIIIDHHPGFTRVPGSAKIYRVRPRRNDDVNGHFLCDYGRAGFVADHREGRRERIGWNRGGEAESAWSWDKALDFVAAKIRSLLEDGKSGRIGTILHCGLTNEELEKMDRLLGSLGARAAAFADGPGESDEGILLLADRTPNRAGAVALGFDPRAAEPMNVVAQSDLLLIFETNRTVAPACGPAVAALEKVGTKVLFTTHETPLAKQVDLVLPVAAPAENRGSYTNAAGRVQRFEPAVAPCGDIRPAADVLADLAARLEAKR
jgi:NADH-quinone oxidoreductase subunit G